MMPATQLSYHGKQRVAVRVSRSVNSLSAELVSAYVGTMRTAYSLDSGVVQACAHPCQNRTQCAGWHPPILHSHGNQCAVGEEDSTHHAPHTPASQHGPQCSTHGWLSAPG